MKAMGSLYESSLEGAASAGWVPVRPMVVRSRRPGEAGGRWWALYPDGSTEWFWAGTKGEGAEDARFAAHAWCETHVEVL